MQDAAMVVMVALSVWLGAGTQAARVERLTDPQVKLLVKNIDRGFERWKDDLERRNMDDAVIRSAAGNVDVHKFLDDMEHDIDLVEDRLESRYAAGPEITALLRRASDVERRYGPTGAPETWTTLGRQFAALAAAYGVGWPIDAAATGQRKMDGELARDAARLADAIDPLRNAALKAASAARRPKAEREDADRMMRDLKRAARQLESHLDDHRAMPSEATRVLELGAKAVAFARGVGPMDLDANAALTAIESSARSIAAAFRAGWP